MAVLDGTNYAKKNAVPFELSNQGSNNAGILTASDYFEIPVGADLAALDEINLSTLIPKGSKFIDAEIFSNEALGGAAEFSLGIRQNNGEFSGGDDATALVASATLGGAAGNAGLSNFLYKGESLLDDAELFLAVIAPTVVGASAKKIQVIVYYINV